MKVLVIGGTGATGPFVVDGLIKRGYEVTVFHRGVHEIELPSDSGGAVTGRDAGAGRVVR